MKTKIMLVAMLLLAGGLIALLAKTPPDTPEQQIRELEDKVNGAYAANDLTAYFSYYAPDFSQWLPEGRTDLATYQKEWTGFIHGGGRVESANYSDLHTQVGPSGDTAVASYILRVRTRNAKGEVSEEDNQESDVAEYVTLLLIGSSHASLDVLCAASLHNFRIFQQPAIARRSTHC